MSRTAFRRLYGDSPVHLLAVAFCVALVALVIASIGLPNLWNSEHRLQSIAVWFIGAALIHDLVLFPLYALVDRALIVSLGERVNYIRVPALGAGLSLLLFFPGILRQGSQTYRAATGTTQEPFALRWVLLVVAMFVVSGLVYAVQSLRTTSMRRRGKD